jgi:hypothetical protein
VKKKYIRGFVDQIFLAQNREQCQVLVNIAVDLQIPKKKNSEIL